MSKGGDKVHNSIFTLIKVEYKPMKKMKKRRELDALVNGKVNRGRNNKKSQELLLENISDSSDIEEFSLQSSAGKTVVRKRGFCQFCRSCMAICSYFILVSCVIAVIGLLWIYVDLKHEIDSKCDDLQAQIRKYVLSSSTEPEEVHVQLQKLTADLESLKLDIVSINSSISYLEGKISDLDSNAVDVKKSIALAAELKDLPGNVANLKQSCADLGSNIETIRTDVQSLRNDYIAAENKKMDQNDAIQRLQNSTAMLENRLSLMELKAGTTNLVTPSNMQDIVQQAVGNVMEELKNYTTDSSNKAFQEYMLSVKDRLADINQRISLLETKAEAVDFKEDKMADVDSDVQVPSHQNTKSPGFSAATAIADTLMNTNQEQNMMQKTTTENSDDIHSKHLTESENDIRHEDVTSGTVKEENDEMLIETDRNSLEKTRDDEKKTTL